jgi:hypothetical protein
VLFYWWGVTFFSTNEPPTTLLHTQKLAATEMPFFVSRATTDPCMESRL